MTSNRAKLQALIDTIDSAFRDSSTPEAQAYQQDAIAQVRRYLLELQREGVDSHEVNAQQVLQAVVQEMSYLRSNMVQPLREEVAQLHSERKQLTHEVRQLQQSQRQIQESQQQAAQQQMLQDFMKSLMARLQDQMTTQVVQAIALLQPQLSSSGSSDDGAPSLNTVQQAEQLRQLQATSNELMLKMDSTLRLVFDSLQSTVDSYRESLGHGLEQMHSLGQQGETLFAALINRLASQLGREASQYLSQSLTAEWDPPRLDGTSTSTGTPTDTPTVESPQPADISPDDTSSDVTADEAVSPAADMMSAEQIDQLLRQNLMYDAPGASESDTADSSLQPSLPQVDPDALIDQILQDLEYDIDAIGDGLDLDLDAVDLDAAEADTADDSIEEAIALFRLDDDGVMVEEVEESDVPSVGTAAHDAIDPNPIAPAEPRPEHTVEEMDNWQEPDAAAIEDPAQLGDQPDRPISSDEISAFYAEFQAATEGEPSGAEGNAVEGDGPNSGADESNADEPESPKPAAVEPAAMSTPTSDATAQSSSVDTISRLSDLIDTNLLIQMGTEDTSGMSSSYTMASLGEDLLPTSGDAAKPASNLSVNIGQLAADLSRIEGVDQRTSLDESEASMSGFLPPEDEFFAIDDSEDVAAPLPASTAEIGSKSPVSEELEASLPEVSLPPSQQNDYGVDQEGAPFSQPGQSVSNETYHSTSNGVEPYTDDDVMADTTIDEIAALFEALEKTEDRPSGRSAIAEQTLADLLKPPGGSDAQVDRSADADETASANATNIEAFDIWNDEKKK